MLIPLRDENPTRRFPFFTILLLLGNVLIYLYEFSLGDSVQLFFYRAGAIPVEITTWSDYGDSSFLPVPFSIVSSMFVHGGPMHLAGNMLYLWIFGNNVEDVLGHFNFIFFYLLCGTVAALTHIILNPQSQIPMIGASGAIAGILGAYILLFPNARVKTLLFIFFFVQVISIRAIILLGFWFLIQLLNIGDIRSGVAWFAHIGGFVFGFMTLEFFLPARYRHRI